MCGAIDSALVESPAYCIADCIEEDTNLQAKLQELIRAGSRGERRVACSGQARPLDLISQPWIWIAFRAPALDLDCIFVGLDWILSKKQSRDWIWIASGRPCLGFGLLLPSPALDLDCLPGLNFFNLVPVLYIN